MNLFTPNTSTFDNYYDKAKYLMVWRIILALNIVFSSLYLISLIVQSGIFINKQILLAVIIISIVHLFYLQVTKNYKPAFWTSTIMGTILIHIGLNIVTQPPHYTDILWIIVVILLAFTGLGKKEGIIFTILNAFGLSCFFFFSLNNHITILQPRNTVEMISDILELVFAFSIITYLLLQYIILNKHTEGELIKTNKELLLKSEENIVLLREVHHRVKNNLQIIISLLRLQRNELNSEEEKTHFSEAINRIMVMSLIHKKLYQQTELANVNIKSYLTDLSKDIQLISDLGIPLTIEIDSDTENIGLTTIVPLGLIINELLTNSIKHAFFINKEGLIKINIVKANNDFFLLQYSDNGKWIERKEPNPTFGLELISILTTQLDGEFERISNDKGTTYSFNIKNLDLEK